VPRIRELPQIVGEFTILPKHWWQAADKSGRKRNVAETTIDVPLGSGPYRIKTFEPGRFIVYERVSDYWGPGLNVRSGRDNFDEMHFEYFRDTTIEFEAFKADQFDWYNENAAKNWATGYKLPAVAEKRLVTEEFPIRSVGFMQGFAFNLRRRKFTDARIRRAFNFALDFETINTQIFYGQYTRIGSYFEGTELAAAGLPDGKELEILETARREVPAELFTTPYTNPIGGSAQASRANLREAGLLLESAGYVVRNLKLVDAKTGQPLTAEFLLPDPSYERFVLFVLRRATQTPRHQCDSPNRGRRNLREPTAPIRLRYHHRVVGGIAYAGKRTARLFRFGGCQYAWLAQRNRHSEHGGGHPDR
jgi:microcin C transport system substrate-binding protein